MAKKPILVVDIGGSGIKVFATGRKKPVEIPSDRRMTPQRMMLSLHQVTNEWKYELVSISYPGQVRKNAPQEEAPNLGKGWCAYDFRKAFRKPVKILNDAAMQALGSYRGGRMLFLGLGTGLGSALVLEGVVHATEFGDLPFLDGRPYAEFLGHDGLKRIGKAKWTRHVKTAICQLRAALQVDYVVVGGGKAKLIGKLPAGILRGDNSKAFLGGIRAWKPRIGHSATKLMFA
jgi:predicted NBD/HSP70 family sugar kinase